MLLRISALIPIIGSGIVFSICLVLLLSGTSPENGPDHYWISLNTSKVGQEIIQLSPASSSNASPNDPTGQIGGVLNDMFGGLFGNLTAAINNGLQDVQGEIIGNLTKALGIKDNYSLFTTKICQGDYADAKDPSSAVTLTSCTPYSTTAQGLLNITNSIPDHFIIGTTNVSVPLVSALGSTLDSVASLAVAGSQAMFVLLVISAAASGLVILGSLVLVCTSSRFLVVVTMSWALVAELTLLIFAIAATGVIFGGVKTTSSIGGALGLQTKAGRPFLQMAWVSALFAWITGTYWFMVWFVDFRRTAFAKRQRTDEQIGHWRGIWREVRDDLSVKRARKEV